jgi:drug/metabolite transporter (DMT)-like permease
MSANVFLRSVIDCDPFLVSAVKAFPATAILAVWLWVTARPGQPTFPSGRILVGLLLAGLLGQLAGNVLFQWSLGIVGIALTVPICMGSIISSGALMGRVYLNEGITWRTLLSIGILMGAIWVLSSGAGDAYQSIVREAPRSGLVIAGVLAACVAGVSYSILGCVIRYTVSGRASVAATTWTTSAVGLVSLGIASVARIGWSGFLDVSASDWSGMLLAGVCNFVAFLALARALQLTTLVYINALNATQVAMAAIIGVVLFGEPLSSFLGTGILLTVVGLAVMPRKSIDANSEDQRPSEPPCEPPVQNSRNRSSNSCNSVSSQAVNGSAAPTGTGSTTASSSVGSNSALRGS